MSRINFIYPLADIHHPTTGGQVYDQRLFNEFRTLGKRTILWNNNKLRIQSRKELFFALIKIIRKFKNDEIVIFNSSFYIFLAVSNIDASQETIDSFCHTSSFPFF